MILMKNILLYSLDDDVIKLFSISKSRLHGAYQFFDSITKIIFFNKILVISHKIFIDKFDYSSHHSKILKNPKYNYRIKFLNIFSYFNHLPIDSKKNSILFTNKLCLTSVLPDCVSYIFLLFRG